MTGTLKSPRHFFLTSPSLFKIWDWKLSNPSERGGGVWYCELLAKIINSFHPVIIFAKRSSKQKDPLRCLTWFDLLLSSTIDWNLSGFAFVLFSWNHLMATLSSDSMGCYVLTLWWCVSTYNRHCRISETIVIYEITNYAI